MCPLPLSIRNDLNKKSLLPYHYIDRVLSTSKTFLQGLARTHVPTNRNYDPEVITFGLLAGVSQTEVQWKGLFLGEPPS